MTESVKLRNERAKVIEDMQAIVATAQKEDRNLNTEEKVRMEKMRADVASLQERYERIEELERMSSEIKQHVPSAVDPLKGQYRDLDITEAVALSAKPEYRSAIQRYLRTGDERQLRDLNVTTAADGGYTLPTAVSAQITLALNTQAFVQRAGASVLNTSVNTVFPVSSTVTGSWGTEASPLNGGSTTDPTISAFSANAFRYDVNTKVSKELITDSVLDIDSYIGGLFAQEIARAVDAAYVNGAGSGSGQPTGYMSSATAVTAASSSIFTDKELVNTWYALPAQYKNDQSVAWSAQSSTIAFIAGLFAPAKATTYIPFSYSTVAGQPDSLFGRPIYAAPSMDSAFTTGKELLAVGNFKYYQIVNRINQAGILRLTELFALTNQMGYVMGYRTDGKLLLPDAFRKLKLA